MKRNIERYEKERKNQNIFNRCGRFILINPVDIFCGKKGNKNDESIA